MDILKIEAALGKVNSEYVTEEYCYIWKPTIKPELKMIDFLTNTLEKQLDIKFIQQLRFINELGKDSLFLKANMLSFIEAWLYCFINDKLNTKKQGKQKVKLMLNKFIDKPGQPIQDLIKNIVAQLRIQENVVSKIYSEIQGHSFYQEYLISLKEQKEQPQIPTQKQNQTSIDRSFIIEQFEKSVQDLSKMPTDCPQSLLEQRIQKLMMKECAIQGQERSVSFKDLKQSILKHQRNTSKINKLLEQIEENPSTQLDKLYLIKSQIVEIDIHQLERLIKKTEEAKSRIRDQQIIFFIGATGAGKTTAILKSLGYLLKEGLKGKLKTLITQGVVKEEHKSLLTSPESRSITRYILAVQVPQKLLPSRIQQKIYVCDSPGFGDSAGVQVDIANGVGMIQGICECKSVRIALVVSAKNWTDRGQGVKELGKTVSGLFHDYQAVSQSITFIFNKFTKETEQQLPHKCDDLLKNLTHIQKANNSFYTFICYLQQNAKNNERIMIKPQENDAKEFMEKLTKLKPLKDPSEYFKYSFTDKTKQSIKSTIKDKSKYILKSFDEQKYELTIYYAQLLKTFYQLIESEQGKQTFIDCVTKIEKAAKLPYESFERNLKQRVLKNQANEDTITEMKQCEKKLKEMQCLSKIAKIPKIMQLEQMKQEESKRLTQQLEKSQSSSELISVTKLFAQHFDNKLEEQINSIITIKFKRVRGKLMSIIKDEIYAELKEVWEEYMSICKLMEKIQMNNLIQQGNENALKTLSQNINKYTQLIEQKLMISLLSSQNTESHILTTQGLSIKPIAHEAIHETKKILEKLSFIIDACLPNSKEIKNLRKMIINKAIASTQKMLQKSNNIIDQCEQIGNQLQDKVCRTIKKCQMDAQKLIKIEQVNQAVGSQVRYSCQNIKKLIESQTNNIHQIIEAFKGEKIEGIKSKLMHIKQIIARVKSLSQSGEDQTLVTAASNLEGDVKTAIFQYLTTQHKKTDTLSLNLKFCNEIMIQKNLLKLQQITFFSKHVNITPQIKVSL